MENIDITKGTKNDLPLKGGKLTGKGWEREIIGCKRESRHRGPKGGEGEKI